MKTSRFTEEQIAFAIKQHELGTRVEEICRKMGISDATFYKWRQKYAGLGPSELKKFSQTVWRTAAQSVWRDGLAAQRLLLPVNRQR